MTPGFSCCPASTYNSMIASQDIVAWPIFGMIPSCQNGSWLGLNWHQTVPTCLTAWTSLATAFGLVPKSNPDHYNVSIFPAILFLCSDCTAIWSVPELCSFCSSSSCWCLILYLKNIGLLAVEYLQCGGDLEWLFCSDSANIAQIACWRLQWESIHQMTPFEYREWHDTIIIQNQNYTLNYFNP